MRWADERYVRLYTRDTPAWAAMGWEAQSLLMLMLRKFDRAGIIELGKTGVRGLAALVSMPVEVTERALGILLEDGVIERRETSIVCPNFLEAQECTKSDAGRQRDHRAKARSEAMSRNVTGPSRSVTDSSQDVTRSHEVSQTVTPYLAVPSLTDPDPSHRISDSSEPAKPTREQEPWLITFPCVGKQTSWGLVKSMADEWKAAYPGVDVLAEARRALAWINANPTKRKTARGMSRFLLSWISKEQDSPRRLRRLDGRTDRAQPVTYAPLKLESP